MFHHNVQDWVVIDKENWPTISPRLSHFRNSSFLFSSDTLYFCETTLLLATSSADLPSAAASQWKAQYIEINLQWMASSKLVDSPGDSSSTVISHITRSEQQRYYIFLSPSTWKSGKSCRKTTCICMWKNDLTWNVAWNLVKTCFHDHMETTIFGTIHMWSREIQVVLP